MNIKRLIIAIVILTLSAAADPAIAGSSSKWSVKIQKAFVDSDENNLTIIGKNFHRGRSPKVWLADERLSVLSAGEYWIVVELPDEVEPGDYLLKVRTGYGYRYADRFDLTIPDPAAVSPSMPQLKVVHVEQEYLRRTLNANTLTGLEVICPEGTVLTGGGVRQLAFATPRPATDTFDYFVGSYPFDEGGGAAPKRWIGSFHNPTSSPVTINVAVSALCASVE